MTTPPRKYDFLKQEARSPYRGLRKFFYGAFGFSGAMGGLIALLRLLAQRGDLQDNAQNLLIQLLVVGVMVYLWRIDRAT
jgi:hypothetical protein